MANVGQLMGDVEYWAEEIRNLHKKLDEATQKLAQRQKELREAQEKEA